MKIVLVTEYFHIEPRLYVPGTQHLHLRMKMTIGQIAETHQDVRFLSSRQFKTTIFMKLTFLLSGSQWEYYKKSTKAFSFSFACVPCCHNDKDVTSYEGYQKSNSFRRYFNQIY